MNATTPGQPGDGYESGQDPTAAGADPLIGNPYSSEYRGEAAPDLDAGAPQLRSNDLRRMNRRALAFLGAIVVLLLVLAIMLYESATTPAARVPKAQAETVAPVQPPPIPPPAPLPAKPIPLAAAAQVPTLPVLRMPPKPVPQQVGPSLLQRREGSTGALGSLEVGAGTASARAANAIGSGKGAGPTSAKPLLKPDTLLLQGTYIRCVLETRIISDIRGYTSCIVSEPVYSFDGKYLLLPKGSKVFGRYDHGPTGSRIAVIWNRIVTPTGVDVSMASPGVDNLGSAGHPGYLDSHWPSRIRSALLISLMSDAFLYEGEKHGPRTPSIGQGGVVVQSPYQSNTAQALQDLSRQAVAASANRAPTLTINQGTVLTIYVARDVDFSGVVGRY